VTETSRASEDVNCEKVKVLQSRVAPKGQDSALFRVSPPAETVVTSSHILANVQLFFTLNSLHTHSFGRCLDILIALLH
jgi:hypothetical protein